MVVCPFSASAITSAPTRDSHIPISQVKKRWGVIHANSFCIFWQKKPNPSASAWNISYFCANTKQPYPYIPGSKSDWGSNPSLFTWTIKAEVYEDNFSSMYTSQLFCFITKRIQNKIIQKYEKCHTKLCSMTVQMLKWARILSWFWFCSFGISYTIKTRNLWQNSNRILPFYPKTTKIQTEKGIFLAFVGKKRGGVHS